MDDQGLLNRARIGDAVALGQLLESHRGYLRLLARQEIGRQFRGKVGASDIVQDVFFSVYRQFPNFQGTEMPQFEKWLQTILAGTLANMVRHYRGTQARDLNLERAMVARFDQSTCGLHQLAIDPRSSPSQHAAGREMTRLVAEALTLLPDDYQEVLTLRHLEGLTFPQIAEQLGRSVDSVEKLWLRGIAKLRKQFVEEQL
ncbi:MAG TPA: sigma-70 family RNA polymerase sigma factor [Pirellulaceae bacterium]|nr:sigma-70 family RNA polymerase sigma factor [Pirellulaceae bacterium]HMO94093.1 sigma-70 family RNA polymerase sigma factor [Pirellulaceae bacterium]HMP71020.1 sigma-70 family RNA polymerase sigma factor [Pirellulaceae bacterium]